MNPAKSFDYRALFDLSGRLALVVGGGSGIGQAGAEGLAAHGAHVVVADITGADAEGVAARIEAAGGKASALPIDVRDTGAVERMVAAVVQEHGRLDVLLTTPAVNLRKRLLDYTDEEFDRVIELNLKGTFRVARACARVMAERKTGSIILMASIRAVSVEPGQSIYASTKAGIVQMARGLAAELGPSGVRVNALAPGIVATPLTRPIMSNAEWNRAYASRTALGRWADPEEMAGPIVFLASDASSYLTGTIIFADAGWTAIDGRFEPPGSTPEVPAF
jgi:NAD(P)-dependent dehydrogenase (short-subunit alcohol dehydrogenase family)